MGPCLERDALGRRQVECRRDRSLRQRGVAGLALAAPVPTALDPGQVERVVADPREATLERDRRSPPRDAGGGARIVARERPDLRLVEVREPHLEPRQATGVQRLERSAGRCEQRGVGRNACRGQPCQRGLGLGQQQHQAGVHGQRRGQRLGQARRCRARPARARGRPAHRAGCARAAHACGRSG
ncbi:MAG: hypothetical protein ACK559_00020, partial [bacterium]